MSGLTVVGEGGPELADFDRPARVYSNDALQRALQPGGGGGGQVISIDFRPTIQSSDGPGVRAALQEALPAIRSEIVSAVQLGRRQTISDLTRPGPTRFQVRGT